MLRMLLLILLTLPAINPAQSQTFTLQTGASNPMNGVDVGSRSDPVFVDIDLDGDWDLFIGENDGIINYYENTGTSSAPIFTLRTGASNPFNGVDVGAKSAPEFVDIDADGDIDCFIGERTGNYNYYENTGTSSVPTFTLRTGASNPLNGFTVSGPGGTENNSNMSFADLDNDNDFDLIGGEGNGLFHYYENTGTVFAASFTERFGASNPMNGEDVGQGSIPAFIDLDSDGDWDLIVGAFAGDLSYFENTGTAASATFTERTGASNPFNGVDVGFAASPTFKDLTGDDNADAMIGEGIGVFNYYTGSSTGSIPLPIQLLGFSVECQNNTATLRWSTASETNNAFFTIEKSTNNEFVELAQVEGALHTTETKFYSYLDPVLPGWNDIYYRLSQTDLNGTRTYLKVMNLDTKACGLANEKPLKTYPNPNKGTFIIEAHDAKSAVVLSKNGRVLQKLSLTSEKEQLNITNYTGVVYLLLYDEWGKVIHAETLTVLP